MAKVFTVPKSRRPHTCDRCRNPIPVGAAYRWLKPRYGSKKIRCMREECRFRNTDRSSAKTAVILDAIEDNEKLLWSAGYISDIQDLMCAVGEVARDVGDEYDEAISAWPDGSQPDMEEKRDACHDFADECENWQWDGHESRDELRAEVMDELRAEADADDPPTDEQIEDETDKRWEEELDEARNDASQVLDGFSL